MQARWEPRGENESRNSVLREEPEILGGNYGSFVAVLTWEAEDEGSACSPQRPWRNRTATSPHE